MKFLHLFTVFGVLLGSAYGQTTVNGRAVEAGTLIFDENFDTFDHSIWQHEKTLAGGGNWEFQLYDNTRSNSYVKDGILYLTPTLLEDRYGEGFVNTGTLDLNGGYPAEECTNPAFYGCFRAGANGALNPVISARLRTVNSFSFKYGRVEVRAKTPTGDWLWPAIWLLPRYNAYGLWPASGEIDMMESRGNLRYMQNGVNIGAEQVTSTLHWGPYWPVNGYTTTTWPKNSSPGYNKDFHLYQLEWTPDYIKFFVDGVETGMVSPGEGGFWQKGVDAGLFDPEKQENPWRYSPNKIAPFDEEFFFILNVAVGGTNGFFPDDAVNDGPPRPWSLTSNNALGDFWAGKNSWYPTWEAAGEDLSMAVDYIKVWAL